MVAAIIASTYAAMNPQTKKSNMESGVESGVEMGLKTASIGIQMIYLFIRWVMLVLMTALTYVPIYLNDSEKVETLDSGGQYRINRD